jgi:hypothetical protein
MRQPGAARDRRTIVLQECRHAGTGDSFGLPS